MNRGRAGEMLCERPGYKIVEQGLYIIGAIAGLAMLFALPSLQLAQRDAAEKSGRDIASEDMHYCEGWGMASGTAAHLACLRDLIRIREETERRTRDDDEGWF